MEILTSVKRLYISFKSLVNDFVYSFGRAALLLLVEVQNHTVPVRERGRIRVNVETKTKRTLHNSRRLSCNEITNAKILCCIVAILFSTDANARLCDRRAL